MLLGKLVSKRTEPEINENPLHLAYSEVPYGTFLYLMHETFFPFFSFLFVHFETFLKNEMHIWGKGFSHWKWVIDESPVTQSSFQLSCISTELPSSLN